MPLGEAVRACRRGRRWTQARLAQEAGVSALTVLRLEKHSGPLNAWVPWGQARVLACLPELDEPIAVLDDVPDIVRLLRAQQRT